MFHAQTNLPLEFPLTAAKKYPDPFNEIEVDVLFTGPNGMQWRVPAFWAGDSEFRVRFAAPKAGRYTFQTVCTNEGDPGLHGRSGELEVAPYDGANPLYRHGGLKVAATRRSFEHQDGTPFFWLGDTWWMGLCKRLGWPGDFQALTADRVAKGFNVIQIVAGLYPDMPPFDERGANEAGFPWEPDYVRINPAYFDMADLRVQWLVRSGLVPCIVGSWSYFAVFMGPEKLKKHWRYLAARWGAYPVLWCLAGEWTMPYYLSEDKEGDEKRLRETWAEVARYVKRIDAFQRLRSVHEGHSGREIGEAGLIDFQMLQTGHSGAFSIPNTLATVKRDCSREPRMPVLVSEVNYEGLVRGNYEEIQRIAFWASVLSGAAGHTYGANGIWQVNTRTKPFGPSPHGGTWGNQPWEDACQLPGSKQLGLAKRLLERYQWWRFEPHQEWIEPHASVVEPRVTEDDFFTHFKPYAAGIPGQVRVIYSWFGSPAWGKHAEVRSIEPGVRYKAFFFNPRDGQEHPLGAVRPDSAGSWTLPNCPTMEDWLLVLERE